MQRGSFSVRRMLRGACLALLMTGLCVPPGAAAEAEFLVKAAFLYNFAKFVQWPGEVRGDAFSLCVLGDNPFGGALSSLAGKRVEGREIVVNAVETADAAADCRMVFVAASERDRLGDILPLLEARHVLSVSDMEDFASHGGMIELLKRGNKIRFEVNIASAEAAGLTISSSLLRLAQTVHRKTRTGDS